MMKKTVALTFITTAVLLMMSLTTYLYGQDISSAAEDSLGFSVIACVYDMQLDSWEKAAGLIALLAFSTFIAGGLLWERESQPQAKRLSMLGLNEIRAKKIVRVAAPCERAVMQATNFNESYTRHAEDDYLTPLERVIRGY